MRVRIFFSCVLCPGRSPFGKVDWRETDLVLVFANGSFVFSKLAFVRCSAGVLGVGPQLFGYDYHVVEDFRSLSGVHGNVSQAICDGSTAEARRQSEQTSSRAGNETRV